ncbi:hypothetical protein AGLY_013206 [Aphis glycines]|uniref:Uncharacterized protein n=1 Tax=Aphis glycines TaxID=307491 RepID=A0A6G0T5M6_APHGL|nr:hypothetical protein AGLY_013206 [Aphis glycines]
MCKLQNPNDIQVLDQYISTSYYEDHNIQLQSFQSKLRIGKWVPLCCTLGSGVDRGLGIYDLYFLNNNKYLKSFEDKSLSLRDFLKILNSNALKIFPIMMLRVFSIATCRKTYGKLSVVFLILSYKHKTFYNFLISKLLANFRVIDRFPTIRTTHKEPCIKFSSFFGHPKFFYRHFKKKFTKESKIDLFLNYNHIKKSIRSKTGFA